MLPSTVLLLSLVATPVFPKILGPKDERDKDGCHPVTWRKGLYSDEGLVDDDDVEGKGDDEPATSTTLPVHNIVHRPPVAAGAINCRYESQPRSEVNSDTCQQLADEYQIDIDKFFKLNPTLHPDCSNIETNTEYCVAGFIEPLRAHDGKCGPPNNDATCLGVSMGQCCNSETWTCGKSDEDCAKGTCYEGVCYGDRVYSTDGTCGTQHGNRQCAGKWGNCCHNNGTCGNGEEFCGVGNCQLGNCAAGRNEPTPLGAEGIGGNTTDGRCGGPENLTCNFQFGRCCSKDGICGTQENDCGVGCQRMYGQCNYVPPSKSTTSAKSLTQTAAKDEL